MNRKKLLFPALLVLVLATAVTITTATFTTSLSTVNNSGVDVTNFISHHPLSGEALLDGGFTDADTLNIALVDGNDGSTVIPSQPPSLQDALDGAVADDGGAQTTETTESANGTINDMTLLPAAPVVDDAYYFGSDHPFRILTLNTGTAGVGVWDITWEYYMTSGWIPLTNVDDRTIGFKLGGTKTVSYDMPDDWLVQTVNGVVNKYWIRARVTDFTSVVAAPTGTQSWWETGAYIALNDSLVAGQQTINTLALGSTVDLVEGHQFFPGDAGYLVLDHASLENASDYLIRIAAYIETDATAPGTSSILEKTAAWRIYNPADGTIRLRLNGATDLDITGVEDGFYIMDIYDDSVRVTFTIYGVGVVDNATVAIADNANDWEFGTEGAVTYFDQIIVGTPLVLYQTTQTHYSLWDLTDTIWTPLPDDGSLIIDGWVDFDLTNTMSVCGSASQRNHPDFWDVHNCFSFQEIGWNDCASVFGAAGCKDGDFVLHFQTPHGSNRYVSMYEEHPAVEAEVYSMGAYCNDNNSLGTYGISVEFLDVSFVSLQFVHNKGAGTKCGVTVWNEVKLENQTAPANTAWVRFHVVAESTGISSRAREVQYDEVRANLGTTVVATIDDPDHILDNGSFEIIYPDFGDGISIPLDPTSITSVTQTSVDWSVGLPAGTSITVNASIDNGGTWVEVENSGDPIPGISIGEDLSLFPDFKVQAILNSDSENKFTPSLEDITMVIMGTGADLDGWWQPNELIGDTLTDRSPNTNDADTSFPLPTDSHDFQFVTGPFVSTGFSDIADVTGTGIDVVPEISEVDIIAADTDFSYLPFHDLVVLVAGDFIPIEIAWALLTGVVIVVIGMFAMVFLGSVALSGGIMAILTLFATNVGTDGIIPFWVFAFAALGVTGILIWTHPKVSL